MVRSPWLARALGLAAAAVALAVGLVSLRVAQSAPGLSYLVDANGSTVLGLGAGWGLVAVGLESRRRGRWSWFGSLLVLAGVAWLLPDWSDPGIGSPIGFTFGLAFTWLYPAVVGHALETVTRSGTARSADRIIVALGYGLFVLGLGIAPALAFDPVATGCTSCPSNLIHVLDPGPWLDPAMRAVAIVAAGWTALVTIVLIRRVVAGRPAARRRAALIASGATFLVFVGVELARDALLVVPPTDSVDHGLRVGQAVALICLAAAVAWEWLRARQARDRVARLVADLAVSPPVGGLRDQLATLLRDPGLRLVYPSAAGRLVDAAGRDAPLRPSPGWATTPILRGGTVVAVIDHDANVLRDPAEIDEVVAAARLGLEHERLQAELRAQLDALRLARRRIVEAGDAERKRLERDLHDGAQQHLIALSIALQLLDGDARTAPLLERASAEIHQALDDLREIAHGIYPAVLDDEGLAAAVEALAESSTVPILIRELAEERCPTAVEIAAYELVMAAVRSAAGPVEVRIKQLPSRLLVQATLPAIADDVAEDVADRIGAVDGSMSVTRAAGSATIAAEIPCAS